MSGSATIGTSHDARVKKFHEKLMKEHLHGTVFAPFMGESDSAIIQVLQGIETQGDQHVFNFRPKLDRTQAFNSTQQLKGNESDLVQYVDTLTVDEVNNAVQVRKKDISQVRSMMDLMEQQRMALQEWASERLQYDLLNELCSQTAGRNANRYLYGSSTSNYNATHATALANVDSSNDKLTLKNISIMKRKSRTGNAMVRPVKIGMDEKMPKEEYVLFAHEYMIRDLFDDVNFQNARLYNNQGQGGAYDGAFYKGSWDGVAIFEMPDPEGLMISTGAGADSIDVGQALLCGSQASVVGFNMNPEMRADNDDYDRVSNMGLVQIRGQRKTVFNSEDFGVVHGFFSAVAD